MGRVAVLLLLLAGSLGCASSSSAPQAVPVITEPSGATVTAGTETFRTPGSVIVPSGAREMEIRIDLEGYEAATVLLTRAESEKFGECLDRATSAPRGGSRGGPSQWPASGLAIIGSKLLRAAADCSRQSELLVPGFVFVKLVPSDLPPVPAGRAIGVE